MKQGTGPLNIRTLSKSSVPGKASDCLPISPVSLLGDKSKNFKRLNSRRTKNVQPPKNSKNSAGLFKRETLLQDVQFFDPDNLVSSDEDIGEVFELKIEFTSSEIESLKEAFKLFMDPETKKIDFYELNKALKSQTNTNPLILEVMGRVNAGSSRKLLDR